MIPPTHTYTHNSHSKFILQLRISTKAHALQGYVSAFAAAFPDTLYGSNALKFRSMSSSFWEEGGK